MPVCARCLESVEPISAEFACVQCRTPFVNDRPLDDNGVCLMCREGLRGYDAAFSYGSYEGTLRRLIHVFKYERVDTLASPLGALLSRAMPRDHVHDAVVAMPMHWFRRYQRGFNQADLLAREIGRRLGAPVVAPLARRWGTRQSGLTNAERRKNVGAAFRRRNGVDIAGARVLLVDDVLTTGSSAAACARALKSAGAVHVSVLTLARADRRIGASDVSGAKP